MTVHAEFQRKHLRTYAWDIVHAWDIERYFQLISFPFLSFETASNSLELTAGFRHNSSCSSFRNKSLLVLISLVHFATSSKPSTHSSVCDFRTLILSGRKKNHVVLHRSDVLYEGRCQEACCLS